MKQRLERMWDSLVFLRLSFVSARSRDYSLDRLTPIPSPSVRKGRKQTAPLTVDLEVVPRAGTIAASAGRNIAPQISAINIIVSSRPFYATDMIMYIVSITIQVHL